MEVLEVGKGEGKWCNYNQTIKWKSEGRNTFYLRFESIKYSSKYSIYSIIYNNLVPE